MPEELTQTEAMKYLGVSKPTLIRYRKKGYIEGVRRGGRWYYTRETLDAVRTNQVEFETAAERRVSELLSTARIQCHDTEQELESMAAVVQEVADKKGAGKALNVAVADVIRALKQDLVERRGLLAAARREFEIAGARIGESQRKRLETELQILEGIDEQKAQAFDQGLDYLIECKESIRKKSVAPPIDWLGNFFVLTKPSREKEKR